MEPRKSGVKPKFKYNKTGKFTKTEVQRTSKNIFDWFRTGNDKEHPLLDRAGDGDHEHGGEGGVGGMLLFAEGHQDTPRGVGGQGHGPFKYSYCRGQKGVA